MRHRKNNSKSRLGRAKGHRELMLRNILTSLFVHEKLKTTATKAKIVRSSAEKLISKLKTQDQMNAIRTAKKLLLTSDASKKSIEIAKRYQKVSSGYTRLTNLGPRVGDASPMVLIEFVETK